MGTMIMVIAVSFHTLHFPEGTARVPLVQVQAAAQAICQAKHAEGQAQPMRGGIGLQTPGGVEVLPAAMFGCFIPDGAPSPRKEG